ncbi:MAG: response regulator [Planctomycetes bacterium]|nr:response regulator [Planctomycetota bacterium]
MKVLLVDDSMLSRKVQAKVLREVGVSEIVEAKDGLDAFAKLEDANFEVGLVLTDWNMPGLDGVSLIKKIRAHPRGGNLPVIVISSEFQPDKVGQAFKAGASAYVTKPFRTEVLRQRIASVRGIADLTSSDKPLLEGDLSRLGFAELVSFLNYSQKSGELIVNLESGEAGASFENGEVRDAWIGRFSSEAAFRALTRLERGSFSFHEGRPPRTQRIQASTLSLLMEAVKALDEEGKGG